MTDLPYAELLNNIDLTPFDDSHRTQQRRCCQFTVSPHKHHPRQTHRLIAVKVTTVKLATVKLATVKLTTVKLAAANALHSRGVQLSLPYVFYPRLHLPTRLQ